MSHLRRRENGFGNVPGYRLYCLDGVNKVTSAEWIEADDDKAAVDAVREKYNGSDCELWQGVRLVARFNLRRTG